MSLVKVKIKGDYKKTTNYLKKAKKASQIADLDRYGQEGVALLSKNTPYDTGETSESWSYEIVRTREGSGLVFKNSNNQNGVNIAIILQYGHGTKNGGYVQGRDYINPAIRPIFDKMAEDLWKGVTET